MTIARESVLLPVPHEFRFSECLRYLARSSNECTHSVEGEALYKAIRSGDTAVMVRLDQNEPDSLRLTFMNGTTGETERAAIAYVTDWLDLETDLSPFYRMAENDALLERLCKDYYGLRLIGIPDLFEALAWAIIGQQISLSFAYSLKRRFVEAFGQKVVRAGRTYWLFPTAEALRGVGPEAFAGMQFSASKIAYILNVAEQMCRGDLSKERLKAGDPLQAQQILLSLRGVGAWTAHYVSMKCLRNPQAFPVGDAGLQNALKRQLGLAQKPAPADILRLGERWAGWEAYATFYLWRSLL